MRYPGKGSYSLVRPFPDLISTLCEVFRLCLVVGFQLLRAGHRSVNEGGTVVPAGRATQAVTRGSDSAR